MLQIDLWKRIVIWAVCALGLLMAMPNAFYPRVEMANDADVADAADAKSTTGEDTAPEADEAGKESQSKEDKRNNSLH